MVKMTPLQSYSGTGGQKKKRKKKGEKRGGGKRLPNKTCGNCLSFLSELLSFIPLNRCLSLASYRFHLVCSAGDMRFMGRRMRRRIERAASESAWLGTVLFTRHVEEFKGLRSLTLDPLDLHVPNGFNGSGALGSLSKCAQAASFTQHYLVHHQMSSIILF